MYLHFPQGIFSPPRIERGLEMIGFDFSFLKIASRSLMCSSGPYDYLQVRRKHGRVSKMFDGWLTLLWLRTHLRKYGAQTASSNQLRFFCIESSSGQLTVNLSELNWKVKKSSDRKHKKLMNNEFIPSIQNPVLSISWGVRILCERCKTETYQSSVFHMHSFISKQWQMLPSYNSYETKCF